MFPEPVQGSFSPPPLTTVTADGDDNIIGEPMIVDGLIMSFCRLAADGVESPIQIVQVDVGGQWTERPPLRDAKRSLQKIGKCSGIIPHEHEFESKNKVGPVVYALYTLKTANSRSTNLLIPFPAD